jgi:hypothetical protein
MERGFRSWWGEGGGLLGGIYLELFARLSNSSYPEWGKRQHNYCG